MSWRRNWKARMRTRRPASEQAESETLTRLRRAAFGGIVNRWREVLVRWVPVLAWMGVIYFWSSRPDLPHLDEVWLEMLLRKIAHASEYMVLGVLLARAVGATDWRSAAAAAALGALYAASDEWHQTFVPGRKGNLGDVALDSAAVLLGVWLYARRRTPLQEAEAD